MYETVINKCHCGWNRSTCLQASPQVLKYAENAIDLSSPLLYSYLKTYTVNNKSAADIALNG